MATPPSAATTIRTASASERMALCESTLKRYRKHRTVSGSEREGLDAHGAMDVEAFRVYGFRG